MKKIILTFLFIFFILTNTSFAIDIISNSSYELKLIADSQIILPSSFADSKISIGGISGAYFDQSNSILSAISDGDFPEPIGYNFEIKYNQKDSPKFKIIPKNYFKIIYKGSPAIKDCEGIAKDINGREYISTEGHRESDKTKSVNPGIFILENSIEGKKVIGELNFPNRLIKNLRNNQSFEALSYYYSKTQNEESLITATESALKYDDTLSNEEKGSKLKIIKFTKNINQPMFDKYSEYAYDLSKAPVELKNIDLNNSQFISGLSDVLALGEDRYLALERSAILYQNEKSKTEISKIDFFIKIFEISLVKATDVKDIKSLSIITEDKIVKKSLVLDLNSPEVLNKIDNSKLDNFETIILGPKLENGNSTIMLITDNNFSKLERNLVLFFELIKK